MSAEWKTNAMVPEAARGLDVATLLEDLKGVPGNKPLVCSRGQAAYELWNQSIKGAGRQAVFDAGAVPPLLKLLEKRYTEQDKLHALGCLLNIITIPECAEEVSKIGLSNLKNCLVASKRDSVIEKVLQIVNALANEIDYRPFFMKDGLIRAIVQVMNGAEKDNILELTLATLYNASSNQVIGAILAEVGFQDILRVMRNRSGILIRCYSVICIQKAMSASTEKKTLVDCIGRLGALRDIVEIASLDAGGSEIVLESKMAIVYILDCFTKTGDNSDELFAARCVEVLVEILKQPSKVPGKEGKGKKKSKKSKKAAPLSPLTLAQFKYATSALCSLSLLQEGEERIKKAQAIPLLVELQESKDDNIRLYVKMLLWELDYFDEQGEVRKEYRINVIKRRMSTVARRKSVVDALIDAKKELNALT